MEGVSPELVQYWINIKLFFAVDTAGLSEPDMVARLLLQLLLLGGSAFFSGSETALFSLSRLDLQQLRRERNPHSETLHALLDQPRRLIISILCGNELINIAAAANMAGILYSLYGPERAGWINIIVMVPLLLLFGEVTPKTIAVSNPVRISSKIVAVPMNMWVRFIAPLRWIIRAVADRITTLIVGEETAKENILHVDEFRSLVEEVANEGELNAIERALIYNLLEANETEIVELMTPRTRTNFLSAKLGVPEIVDQVKAIRHSRIPVFRGHRDNLVGILHAEDIVRLLFSEEDLTKIKKRDLLHPPVVVPLTKKVDEMFDFFQTNNARAAAVLNEFGGVEGFITISDVISFIFGQSTVIGTGEEFYQERDENVYEVPGDMKLTEFNKLTNFGIEDPRMTTIGGVAFRHLDHLPKEGDKVTIEGIIMTVLEMDAHRIAQIRVSRGAALEEHMEEAEGGREPQTERAPAEFVGPIEERAAGIVAEGATVASAISGDDTAESTAEMPIAGPPLPTAAETLAAAEESETAATAETMPEEEWPAEIVDSAEDSAAIAELQQQPANGEMLEPTAAESEKGTGTEHEATAELPPTIGAPEASQEPDTESPELPVKDVDIESPQQRAHGEAIEPHPAAEIAAGEQSEPAGTEGSAAPVHATEAEAETAPSDRPQPANAASNNEIAASGEREPIPEPEDLQSEKRADAEDPAVAASPETEEENQAESREDRDVGDENGNGDKTRTPGETERRA